MHLIFDAFSLFLLFPMLLLVLLEMFALTLNNVFLHIDILCMLSPFLVLGFFRHASGVVTTFLLNWIKVLAPTFLPFDLEMLNLKYLCLLMALCKVGLHFHVPIFILLHLFSATIIPLSCNVSSDSYSASCSGVKEVSIVRYNFSPLAKSYDLWDISL